MTHFDFLSRSFIMQIYPFYDFFIFLYFFVLLLNLLLS
jgi:hypothetical protein